MPRLFRTRRALDFFRKMISPVHMENKNCFHVLVITDIFGRTKAIDSLADAFSSQGRPCRVIDPYTGERPDFPSEQEAYVGFLSRTGHSRYSGRVKREIEATRDDCVVVGFSAGASCAWKALEGISSGRVRHFIGFYPGRIRKHLTVRPSCPATLIFPKMEDHFDVHAVILELTAIRGVECIRTGFLHGFMNPCSENHSPEGAGQFTRSLTNGTDIIDPARFRPVAASIGKE
ncbi:MAG: dienelactone hydrolase family protein [Desulfovibrionales bacterium]